MWHAWKRREKCTRFLVGKRERKRPLGNQGVGGKMGSEWILGRFALGVWTGFDYFRIGTGGGLL
jgi:hypothetical protein